MKRCVRCEQHNPDDANFCLQCGGVFSAEAASAAAEHQARAQDQTDLWRAFIGPSKALLFSFESGWSWGRADEHYLKKFAAFTGGNEPRFALSWHWPAFLFDPFLWFLYRKLYLYAFIYFVGPLLSAILTGDPNVRFVWSVIAGASANYLYFWHVKEHVGQVLSKPELDGMARKRKLQEEGGVQPYVLWVGIVLQLVVAAYVVTMLLDVPDVPTDGPLPPDAGEQAPPGSEQKFF